MNNKTVLYILEIAQLNCGFGSCSYSCFELVVLNTRQSMINSLVPTMQTPVCMIHQICQK